jgi:hypothetical protein
MLSKKVTPPKVGRAHNSFSMDSITMASQRDWTLMQLGPHQYCSIEPEYRSVEPESAESIIMVCLDLVSRASIAVTTVKPAVRVQYWGAHCGDYSRSWPIGAACQCSSVGPSLRNFHPYWNLRHPVSFGLDDSQKTRSYTLKNTLMITTSVAALVVAGGLAFAQGMNEHREQPAAAAPEQKAPEGKTDRQNLSAPQKSGSMKPAPTAQAPEGKTDRKLNTRQKVESEKPAPSAQLPQKPTGAEAVGQGRGSQPSQHNAQTQSERTAPNAAARAPSGTIDRAPRTNPGNHPE